MTFRKVREIQVSFLQGLRFHNLSGHIVGSCSTWCLPGPQGLVPCSHGKKSSIVFDTKLKMFHSFFYDAFLCIHTLSLQPQIEKLSKREYQEQQENFTIKTPTKTNLKKVTKGKLCLA